MIIQTSLMRVVHRIFMTLTLSTVAISVVNSASADDHPEFGRQIESVDERIKILESIALQIRSNLELIETWSGTYEFTDRSFFKGPTPVPPDKDARELGWLNEEEAPPWERSLIPEITASMAEGYWRILKGGFDFDIDRNHGKSRVSMTCIPPVGYVDGHSGTITWNSNTPWQLNWLTTTEDSLEFDTKTIFHQLPGFAPIASLPKAGSRVVYRRIPAKSRGKSHSFDPRDLFTSGMFVNSKRNLYSDICLRRVEFLKKRLPLTSQFYATNDSPPVYTEHVKAKDGSEDFTRYDGRVGFNVVNSTLLRDGKIEIQRLLTYRKVGDIFIPATAEWTLATGAKLEPWFIRSLKLTESSVNTPIDESAFAAEQLKLRYGDRMQDDIKARLFVFDGKEFAPAEEFVYNAARAASTKVRDSLVVDASSYSASPAAPQKGRRILLIVNGGILLCLIAFFVYKRYGRL